MAGEWYSSLVISVRESLREILIIMCIALMFGLNVGFTIYWYHQQAQNQCQALDLLVKIPAPKPSNAAENQSRVFNYKFHNALIYWHNADGC